MKAKTNTIEPLLDEQGAATVLALSPLTLQRWRWTRQGPRFIKVGSAVRYRRSDVLAYIKAGERDNTDKGDNR